MGTARGGSLRKVDHTTPFYSMGGGGELSDGKRTLGQKGPFSKSLNWTSLQKKFEQGQIKDLRRESRSYLTIGFLHQLPR